MVFLRKMNNGLFWIIYLGGVLLTASPSFAFPNAEIVYVETSMGQGLWRYDYSLYNTSTSGESLYSVWLDFGQRTELTNLILPEGWDSTALGDSVSTYHMDSFSRSPQYDIPAGSYQEGLSFVINHMAGDIPYTAYFEASDGAEYATGTTTVVPEPLSFFLFISGVIAMIINKRCYRIGNR